MLRSDRCALQKNERLRNGHIRLCLRRSRNTLHTRTAQIERQRTEGERASWLGTCKTRLLFQPTLESNVKDRTVAIRDQLTALDQSESASEFLRKDTVTIEISRNEASPLLDYSDFKTGLAEENTGYSTDRSVRNFLELVTSQPLVDQ